jgi:hypothetical protein
MTGVRRIKSKRTEVKKVMGGHILELESERLMRVGREEQRIEDEKIIAEKDACIAEKDATITQTNTELAQTRERLKELEAQVAALKKA